MLSGFDFYILMAKLLIALAEEGPDWGSARKIMNIYLQGM
jgi:hypothetical protein